MYEAYYGLNSKPFSILPDPQFMYWGNTHSLAFAMLEYGVVNRAGFTVITGEIGCGKTTLINHLLSKLDNNITVGQIVNTRKNSGELLNWALMAFDQPISDAPYPILYKQFHDFVLKEASQDHRTLLIVDEAQNLGVETLEELRMLLNINNDATQHLQLILVGQPQLREQLQQPELAQFAQRVSSDFHLTALTGDEVLRYIGTRLFVAGRKEPLFTDNACMLIAETSKGIPRVINILCDTSLVYAFSVDAPKVNLEIVEKVISDKSEFVVFPIGNPTDNRKRIRPVEA
jgi:general secretion pathway protein A